MEKGLEKTGADSLVAYREQGFNVLTPMVEMEAVPKGMIRVLRHVQIRSADCYEISRGKWCLLGTALAKLAQVAGVSTVAVARTGDRTHPHLSEYTATVMLVDCDGTRRQVTATKVVDLRGDAGESIPGGELAGMIRDAKKHGKGEKEVAEGERLSQARKFIHEICASKAENRAIRKILGVASNFSEAQLHKPFIVPKLSLDPSDPDAKRAMLAGMSGATDALFGAETEKRVEDGTAETIPPKEEAPKEEDDSAKVKEILHAAFAAGRKAGMSNESMAKLAREVTGVNKSDGLNLTGAEKVADAIGIRVGELSEAKVNF